MSIKTHLLIAQTLIHTNFQVITSTITLDKVNDIKIDYMVLRSMKRHKSNEEIETSIILQSLSFIYIVTSTAEQDSTTCRL